MAPEPCGGAQELLFPVFRAVGQGALCQQHPRSQSRALSWVQAWIHAVPPQGAPLEEEDAGGTAFVSPPALSLGHSSLQEEGSGLPWWLVAEIPPSNAGG